MVLACVMELARFMVLACVMVLARVMVLVRVMVLARILVLARVIVLARVLVLEGRKGQSRTGPKGRQLEVGPWRGARLLVKNIPVPKFHATPN